MLNAPWGFSAVRGAATAHVSGVRSECSLSPFCLALSLIAYLSGLGCASHPKPRLRFIAASSHPFVFVDSAGNVAGVSVELFNAAAQRAGHSIDWVVTSSDPQDVLLRGEADLFHALPLDPPPPPSLHVTKPWIRADYVALIVQGKAPSSPGLRVTLIDHPIDRTVQRRLFPNASVAFTQTRDDGLAAVCAGHADAVVTSPRVARLLARGLSNCQHRGMEWIEQPEMSVPVAVGARQRFGREAEKIRSEIAGIVTRGEAQAIYSRYGLTINRTFSSMVALAEFETQRDRLQAILAVTITLTCLLMTVLAVAIANGRKAMRARIAAEAATLAKSDFLAVMSHEIRTPLHACLGLTELLLASNLSPEQRDLVELSARSAQDLNSLLGDILDLSRIDARKLVIEPVPFNPAILIEHVARMVRAAGTNEGVTVSAAPSSSLPLCLVGDEGRLRQVLLNLAMNARKFTRQGTITIRAAYDGGEFQASVQDTGPGIDADLISRVFERFEQGDASSTRRHRGSGLGLAISKELIQFMGGKIGVVSKSGEGSAFWLTVPLQAGMPLPAPGVAVNRHPLHGQVLVVEDDPINRKVITRLLEKLGLHPTVAPDGETAVQMAGEGSYGAILMDCQMPGMDGFETTRRIRGFEHGAGKRTPIIALTADVSIENRRRCQSAGMDDFLGKPLHIDVLASMLRGWIEHSQETGPFSRQAIAQNNPSPPVLSE